MKFREDLAKNITGRSRKAIVTGLIAVAVFIIVSFGLLRTLGPYDAAPATVSTPTSATTEQPYPLSVSTFVPTLAPTPISRVLPTTDPRTIIFPTPAPLPTSTATPFRSPPPTSTALSAIVSSWSVFTGAKTGFSFSYPTGWSIVENAFVEPGYSPDPQITIYVTNYDLLHAPPGGEHPPGTVKIDLLSIETGFPGGGTAFAVGEQQFAGIQVISDRANGAQLLGGLERTIAIYFSTGDRQWVISAGFSPPRNLADTNTETFYRLVGSIRYSKK